MYAVEVLIRGCLEPNKFFKGALGQWYDISIHKIVLPEQFKPKPISDKKILQNSSSKLAQPPKKCLNN
jgi:hypothetical protein